MYQVIFLTLGITLSPFLHTRLKKIHRQAAVNAEFNGLKIKLRGEGPTLLKAR